MKIMIWFDCLKMFVLFVKGDPSKPTVCGDDQFTCGDGECIPFDDLCDGVSHCQDFTDELCSKWFTVTYIFYNLTIQDL